MPELLNVEITRVHPGKTGTSRHGPWKAYNFYISDPDWKDQKFGYFQSGQKSEPQVGMFLSKLEFEVEQAGEYTNYKVSKLEVKSSEKPLPQTQTQTDKAKPEPDQKKEETKPLPEPPSQDRYLSMYMAYAKDLVVAMMPHSKKLQKCELDEVCRLIARGGLILQTSANDAERIQGQERQKILVAEIKEICTLAKIQTADVKQWLNQTKTFGNKISSVWGNLSFHQTPPKVLESIISTSETWLPLAKEALTKTEGDPETEPEPGKPETEADKTESSSDKTADSEPETSTDVPSGPVPETKNPDGEEFPY